MRIPDWLVFASTIAFIIAVVSFFVWTLTSILEDYFSNKWRKLFEEDLALAVKNSKPTWEQILLIAASRNVKHAQVHWVLQRLLRELLTGRNSDLAAHRSEIEAYIAKMKEAEPFEGIPDEIRIHLERLREHLSAQTGLLEPLTSQIRDLLALNEKEQRHQRYYTVGGFFLGIVGFTFAAYAYFVPYSASPPLAAPPSNAASSADNSAM